jgi:hypothetical protein
MCINLDSMGDQTGTHPAVSAAVQAKSITFRRAFVQFWMNIDGNDQQLLFSAEVPGSLALQYIV